MSPTISGDMQVGIATIFPANGKQRTAIHCAKIRCEMAARFRLDISRQTFLALLDNISDII